MTKENAELKCEMLRQKQPTVLHSENEYSDVKQPIRTMSMYETRERMNCSMIQNIEVRK